jgi:outer membrane cobalamin receptor
MLRPLTGAAIVLTLLTVSAQAQELDSLLDISAFTAESALQKQLNQSTRVASGISLTTRETPGILSVITAEEIQNMGARDITDVLRLIPGFDIAQDIQLTQGIALRGNWANEGKVLVLLDGQPMNELLYQTVAVGNRFPVDAIEKIEIIRGPGSAIYGGSAEYGVINIITKAASSLQGVQVYGTGGFHNNAVGRTNGGIMAAQQGDVFSWDVSVFRGNGIVSDGRYQDLLNEEPVRNLAKTTDEDPMTASLGLRYKGLSFRTTYDEFETGDPVTYISFKSFFVDLQYKAAINDKLTLTPQVRYMSQKPWVYGARETGDPDFEIEATRKLVQVDGLYALTRKTNFTFGAVYFQDKGTDDLYGDSFDGDKTLVLDNVAVYAQALFKHRLANATVGARYEKNNRYGAAFVPRMALTKKIENFHFKVLYSQAFRAPSMYNINIALTGKAKPERSNVFEVELGYQFTPEMLLAVNGYSIQTHDVLIYGSEGDGETFNEWYENFDKSGTNGVEVVYSIKKPTWYAHMSYSFSKPITDNTVTTYEVPGESGQYLGMLAQKVTMNASVSLTKKIAVSSTLIYGGKRYAYTSLDINDEPLLSKLDPYLLTNLFVNCREVLNGFTIGVGVYDLFNQRPDIAQAYNGEFAPIPGRSREYVVKMSYQLNFKKREN